MAISRNDWSTIGKFALIIVICAVISGIVGGVTSSVSNWSSKDVVQPAGDTGVSLNMTVRGVRSGVVGKIFVA